MHEPRNLSLDRARTFLTLVVLLHHAVIPYTYFGHTDAAYWMGHDFIVLANDSFFMAMFFFLSGLFVWNGLKHKGPKIYLRERLLRIGVPFLVGALLLIPAAYYAHALQKAPDLTFADFWWQTITEGPWNSGPIWFLWVLLAFDLLAAALYKISPKLVGPINLANSRSLGGQPFRFWLMLVLITEIAYVPLFLYFGASRWFEFGPLSLQLSRALLYPCYFFLGASVGQAKTSFLSTNELPKQRWLWLLVTLISYSGMWGLIAIKRLILNNPPDLPWWYQPCYGTFFVLFSAAIMLTILAFFKNTHSSKPNVLDRIQSEAYGMFLLHYPVVLWLQYFLFERSWPAVIKSTIAFVLTVILSWAATAVLRKIAPIRRVL